MSETTFRKTLDMDLVFEKLPVTEGQVVAELGCGHLGHFVFPLARLIGPSGTLYAVDIIPEILDDIKKRAYVENLPQIKTVWTNLEVFKGASIKSGTVETAFLINVLNQSEKKLDILRETARLLKVGGQLVLIDWKLDAPNFGPPVKNRLSPAIASDLAAKSGLAIKEQFAAGDYYYSFILKKL
jgi:ubiquinone/menaquinone biosynthesis C-methylase UbiE